MYNLCDIEQACSSENRERGGHKETSTSAAIPEQKKPTDGLPFKMYSVKYSLRIGVTSWRLCSVGPHGCVPRIRLWLLRHDDHSGVLIGAGGTRRPDRPALTKADDVSTRIDR